VLLACGAPAAVGTPPSPAPVASPAPAASPTATAEPGWWRPAPGLSWQWQLSDLPVDLSIAADVYDVDLFESDAELVAALHARGRKAICYISVGSDEDWRPDHAQFPAEVLGEDYEGWPGERWLDIRQIDALAPILRARLDICAAAGFDAVEPDNVDGYANDTGFPLTADDQLRFNRWLAGEAHARAGCRSLKNDPSRRARWSTLRLGADGGLLRGRLVRVHAPVREAGKAVFAAEHTDMDVALADICCRRGTEFQCDSGIAS
jgi:hypothetical protein